MRHYKRRDFTGESVELSELLLMGLALTIVAAEEGYLSSTPTVTARSSSDGDTLGFRVEVELIGKIK